MSFRNARKRAGLSVLEVTKQLGVSDAAIYMWETGEHRPRASKLLEIARLYNCTVDELLKKDEE